MFFPYFYFDPTMLILIPGVIIALWAQMRVQSNFSKYSRVPSRSGISASDMAREILASQGIYNVRVEQVRGTLTDHYDPTAQALRLSDSVGNSNSLAALAVAAHEAGHVLQHKDGYAPLMLRNAAVPVINIGSNLAIPLFIIGLIFSWQPLVQIGILLFSHPGNRRIPHSGRAARGQKGALGCGHDLCGLRAERDFEPAPAAHHLGRWPQG